MELRCDTLRMAKEDPEWEVWVNGKAGERTHGPR